jgi:hypothetical protein
MESETKIIETSPATVTRTTITKEEKKESSSSSGDFIVLALIALVLFAICQAPNRHHRGGHDRGRIPHGPISR